MPCRWRRWHIAAGSLLALVISDGVVFQLNALRRVDVNAGKVLT